MKDYSLNPRRSPTEPRLCLALGVHLKARGEPAFSFGVDVIFRRGDGVDPGERALWGDLMSLGFTFPLCIVLGFFLGRWVGGWFGHPALGQWVGLVWGITTAFWELYKVNRRMARRDDAELKRLKEGKGPDA